MGVSRLNMLPMLLVVLPALLLAAGCSLNPEAPRDQASYAKESAMQFDENRSTPAAMPPIDAARPAAFETATFGLG